MESERQQLDLTATEGDEDDDAAIIPGMPDHVALLCLARLPSRVQVQTCCVSVLWKLALESQVLFSLRLQLRTLETQLLLYFRSSFPQHRFLWMLIDPIYNRAFPIDLPSMPSHCCVQPIVSNTTSGQVLFLSTTGIEKSSCFDVFRRRSLGLSTPLMLANRQHFASASFGGHVYVAGGFMKHTDGKNHSVVRSVERLDCARMLSWESLPDMHIGRVNATAVAMHGELYVIGGQSGERREYSGEIWDANKQEWILVPELWPHHIFGRASPASRVAVVMGRLLAINDCRDEVMVYEHGTKLWTSLGCGPFSTFCNVQDRVGTRFSYIPFGVDKELWVVVQQKRLLDADKLWLIGYCDFEREEPEVFLLACTPFSEGPLTWRRLDYSFDDYFHLVCGVQMTI